MDTWAKLYTEGGKKSGRTFDVAKDGLQKPAMEQVGFMDIEVKEYKLLN